MTQDMLLLPSCRKILRTERIWELWKVGVGGGWSRFCLAKLGLAKLGLAQLGLAKIGLGQTRFWPNLVWTKLVFAKLGFGQTRPYN